MSAFGRCYSINSDSTLLHAYSKTVDVEFVCFPTIPSNPLEHLVLHTCIFINSSCKSPVNVREFIASDVVYSLALTLGF